MILFELLLLIIISFDYYSKNGLLENIEMYIFYGVNIITVVLIGINYFFDGILVFEYIIYLLVLLLLIINIYRNNNYLHIDPLTKLFNRRSFDKNVLNKRKMTNKMAVYYIDVDKFKMINDTYGHHEGDIILKKIAKMLKNKLRKSDKIYRIGGDEFVVVASIDIEENAQKVIEKINKGIEELNFNNAFSISLSIGYAITSANHDLKSIVKMADKEMYLNKQKHKQS